MRVRIIERTDCQPCWQNWRYIRLLYYYYYYSEIRPFCAKNAESAHQNKINFILKVKWKTNLVTIIMTKWTLALNSTRAWWAGYPCVNYYIYISHSFKLDFKLEML